MRALLIVLLIATLTAFSQELCIKEVENDTNEPYLSYALLRTIEKAILESGWKLGCKKGSTEVYVRITSFKETPIAYTPAQRVSSYNLSVSFSVRVGERSFSLAGTVPYSLPSGGLGDIPRRRAIDDLLDKIYWNLLQNFRR
ncbi:hypothetical protein [Hydrogenivirga sp. 128-5-R1-1]|uniref:hypothetical protein n=1 Tax=Hydrogenivirga sp. 128-5-R1-1 TaxID=392423 RepID=UPI00015EF9E5|nr:hypothetical protein [Hydrogenivirga sp. 128-5-R1-1]EDP75257.1 hypothetical protein HG1285_00795 [Hydrogenivirga sp. 128-5-R1-1]